MKDYKDIPGIDDGFGFRVRRGDLTPTILRLLLEKPMHGYEIISTLEERSHGVWRPSAGAVYPVLQLLEEQEFAEVKKQAGKRVYSLTDAGMEQASRQANEPIWNDERIAKLRHAAGRSLVFSETIKLMRTIALNGTDKDRDYADKVLGNANKELRKFLKDEEV